MPEAERVSSREPPPLRHSWVRSVRFEGGIFGGKCIDLSPEMTCLIGIRGSGKSAILECLRYGLELPMPRAPAEIDLGYKEELVRFALGSGGKVIIEVENADGHIFEISRILNERRDIRVDGTSQDAVSVPLERPLFFGQKELVKSGEGSEEELIERLIGPRLDSARAEIAAQRIRVLSILSQLGKLKNLDELEDDYLRRKNDAELRLRLFREHGVEKQLQRQVQLNSEVEHARRAVATVDRYVQAFEAFLEEQESELQTLAPLAFTENEDISKALNALIEKVRTTPQQVLAVVSGARTDLQAMQRQLGELDHRREALKEEFAAVERQLSAELRQNDGVRVRPDDFIRLNADLENAKLALAETKRSRVKQSLLHSELLQELHRLDGLWLEEFKLIEDETERLSTGQGALRIIPKFKGNRGRMLEELRGHLQGSRLHASTLEAAMDGHPDFISLYHDLDRVCGAMAAESGERFRRFFGEALASLLTWQVPNSYEIMYHGKSLREHSLGQRASALILFLLSQRENDMIVIDQPEDDLDNQTIFEDVIKLIRTLKRRTQFVFATHNANFPVLGDAEQVGACTFIAGAGDLQLGSIDNLRIQRAIVSIMEGGREAFARRREIYQLWKH